jgi:type I restriction enzyme S subunit
LLKEKRQAVISHAVTKGLDPNVPMKPSGIEWLGDIPEHWEVTRIKKNCRIRYGIGEPPVYQDEGVPLIRATNVRSGTITPTGIVFVNPNDIPHQRIIWLKTGEIIVVRSGAGTGDSAIITDRYSNSIAGFDMVLTVLNANSMFIQYCLLSNYIKHSQIDLEKMRAAQPHLNAEELGNCVLLLPPDVEQSTIVNYLNERLENYKKLIFEAEKSIELLQERRTALISAAVTGKIDVRRAINR